MLEINRIYNEDCLGLNGMCLIPDKSIDMVLCDLPYGITQNKWDTILPLNILWEQYKRIIKDNGAILLTATDPFSSMLIMSNPKMYRYKWHWDKRNATGFLNAKKQPLRVMEEVLVFYKKPCTYNPQMEIRGKPRKKGGYIKPNGSDNYGDYHDTISINNEYYPTNLISISSNRNDKINPTQKPNDLLDYLIKTYSNEGDLILDNCMGSGSLAVSCVNTNRNFIGFEWNNKNSLEYYPETIEWVKSEIVKQGKQDMYTNMFH